MKVLTGNGQRIQNRLPDVVVSQTHPQILDVKLAHAVRKHPLHQQTGQEAIFSCQSASDSSIKVPTTGLKSKKQMYLLSHTVSCREHVFLVDEGPPAELPVSVHQRRLVNHPIIED